MSDPQQPPQRDPEDRTGDPLAAAAEVGGTTDADPDLVTDLPPAKPGDAAQGEDDDSDEGVTGKLRGAAEKVKDAFKPGDKA